MPKDATPPNFAAKTFTNSHKTVKFVKVFSLECFPLHVYGTASDEKLVRKAYGDDLQYLINCSIQTQRGKTREILSGDNIR